VSLVLHVSGVTNCSIGFAPIVLKSCAKLKYCSLRMMMQSVKRPISLVDEACWIDFRPLKTDDTMPPPVNEHVSLPSTY
uniref:Uncharacterized protein n=1 Tax=Aegilops tauschii subsp. strangulata TaxID=200361 RepID=A0A453I974_AEGTS